MADYYIGLMSGTSLDGADGVLVDFSGDKLKVLASASEPFSESFRAELLAYIAKARPILDDACDELLRTREWIEHDRRVYWQNQFRKRSRVLEDAQAALFSAKLSNLREARTAEQMAVLKAKRSLTEAEDKLRLIRKWSREFDDLVQPLLKELDHLRTLLARDLPRGAIYLAAAIKRIDAYARVAISAVSSELS